MTTQTGTSEPGRSGTYRALPLLEDEVMNLILRYAVGPMDILLGEKLDTLDALKRIDQELEGLAEANPNLALVLRRTVEAHSRCLGQGGCQRTDEGAYSCSCLHQRLYDIANPGYADEAYATAVDRDLTKACSYQNSA